jgi:hypothetical protein
MTIYILGTLYTVEYAQTIGDADKVGKTDFFEKKIYILRDIPVEEFNIVFKHEVIHAFLYESGLNEYNKDEMLVDYFAMQWDKLEDIFQKYLTNR